MVSASDLVIDRAPKEAMILRLGDFEESKQGNP